MFYLQKIASNQLTCFFEASSSERKTIYPKINYCFYEVKFYNRLVKMIKFHEIFLKQKKRIPIVYDHCFGDSWDYTNDEEG